MNKLISIAIIAAATLLSCQEESVTHSNNSSSNLEKVVLVGVERLQLSNENINLKYSGSIEAEKVVPLTFQTSGTVEAVYVEEGDFVKKGDLIAISDKQSIQNAYNAAVAQYEQAVDARARLSSVYNAGSLPEIKWVEIESKVKQAKANMNIYKKSLENCEMRAPFDGYIGKREFEVGMSAMQMQAPIELVIIKNVFANISVPENEISLFEKGLDAVIEVPALNHQTFLGEVSHVGVVANKISRTYSVKINVRNDNEQLKPGMICEVTISKPVQNQLLVPISAITRLSGKTAYVFIVNEKTKKAEKRNIELGGIVNNNIAVLSGILPNELIITSGIHKVFNNSTVQY